MREHAEFGPVPAGWQVKRLPEVCSMYTGGTPPKSDPALWAGTVPWISGKDLKATRLKDATDHITRDAAVAYSKIAPAGSVLVLVRGMGLVKSFALSLIERPMAFNQDLKALVPGDELTGPYLMYALTFAGQRMLRNVSDAAHGTKRLSQSDLDDFTIAVPTLDEQSLIVDVLDCVRRAADLHGRAEKHAYIFKRTAMRELFTRGLRGEVQKPGPFGAIPESWIVTNLRSLCSNPGGSIQTGPFGSQLHAHDYRETGTPVVNPTHMKDNRINHLGIPTIDDETVARLERHRLRVGDLLFARRGVIGRHALVGPSEGGWLCGTGCFVVRIRNAQVVPAFLNFLYSTEPSTTWLEGHAAGAIMPNLNNVVLGELPACLPPADEQREIVEILDAIDQKIDLHKDKKAVLEELFKALLHKLMTGEIRVSDLDLSSLHTEGARS